MVLRLVLKIRRERCHQMVAFLPSIFTSGGLPTPNKVCIDPKHSHILVIVGRGGLNVGKCVRGGSGLFYHPRLQIPPFVKLLNVERVTYVLVPLVI